MGLQAVFIPPVIVVVFARVPENVQHGVVIPDEVVRKVHQDFLAGLVAPIGRLTLEIIV